MFSRNYFGGLKIKMQIGNMSDRTHTGCFETRVQILNGSQNLTNDSNGLIFVLNCRQIITF